MNRTLWILDPSTHKAEEEGVRVISEGWDGAVRVFRPALEPGTFGPAQGYACDAVVVMGSRASVHDSFPWLNDLRAWLRPVLAGEVPVALLGICFGHQLVSQMMGGEVGFLRPDESKLVAVQSSSFLPNRLMTESCDIEVVCSHREVVHKAPPEGFRVISSRPEVAIEGLEHTSLPVVTVQFHPEARREFAVQAGLDFGSSFDQVSEDGDAFIRSFLHSLGSTVGR